MASWLSILIANQHSHGELQPTNATKRTNAQTETAMLFGPRNDLRAGYERHSLGTEALGNSLLL